MGIFARLATLIKSNLNDLISRSEDPEKMLNQVVIDMANQLIEAKKQGAPTEEVDISGYKMDVRTGKHARFIERHAPYHVRRLPSGGVLLATHPYRTLWPFWADALFLLGIRS